MILGENSDQFYIRDELENFVCPECGLKFVTSLDVDLHLRQHTGEDMGSFDHGEVCSGTTEVYTCVERLICFDESSVEILKSVNLHKNPTAIEIENDRSEQPIEDNRRSEKPIEDKRRSEQPFEDKRRSEQPIEGNRESQQQGDGKTRSEKPVRNNRRSKLQQPEENQRTVEQNIEDETSMIRLTVNKKLSIEEPHSVLQSIYKVGSNGPSEETSDTTLNEPVENTSKLSIMPTEATVDEPNQDDPTNDLPLLEKFSPLKSKRDSFLTMPYLKPILPLINYGEDTSSKETRKKPLGLANGARIGQVKKQVVSKHRKTREYVCESFHCYKTFFSNTGLQKHMVQFHPGYVPVSARIHQAPRQISKLNKPKTVKHVRFSEKNQIHIIEPIFYLPHSVKNGKYVCLKCKGVFDDTFDLRHHLNKFKNKLHCDKIKRLKKKGKGKSTVKVKVNVQENAGSDQTKSEALYVACEPILESKLQEMDKNKCSSGTTDKAADIPNYEDSEPFLTKCMNSDVNSDNGKQSFACFKCSKIFFYKKNLMNHLKAHKDVEYPCEFCRRTFTSERYLNEHENNDHKKEFLCSICDTKFIYKNSFRKHMKKHNESPP